MQTTTGTPIGAHIRDWRTRRGFSQREFARELDITAVYLCRVERGRERPSMDLLLRMADVLRARVQVGFRVVRKERREVVA